MNDGLLTDVGAFDVSDPATGRALPTLGADTQTAADRLRNSDRRRLGPLSRVPAE